MTYSLTPTDAIVDAFVSVDDLTRDHFNLGRVISVVNGKGGVGKTETVTHAAALAAKRGYRVLIVDLDPQGNVGEDLGYTGQRLSDDGVGLARAIQYGGVPSLILRDVRTGLDVIPGGEHLEDLAGALAVRRSREGDSALLALATTLAPLAGDYDLIFIDCPPGIRELQVIGLAAASHVVIPTKTDDSSLRGMAKVAKRFATVRRINPGLLLLGIVLYGVTPAAKTARKEARAWVDEAVPGGQALVFEATIRHVEMPAQRIRKFGLLAHELETGPDAGISNAVARTVVALAADYTALTVEMLTKLLAMEGIKTETAIEGAAL